jgi:L-fuculose-phosphate aldolase
MTYAELCTALQQAGREMVASGLTWGNAGNLSARVGNGSFLITASGTRLGELKDDDFALCHCDTALETSGRRPSKEVPMHRAVYEVRPEVGAVLHGAPFYSTLLACTQTDPPPGLFVESMYYLERIARVPYHHPGSAALGEAVKERAKDANVLLLEHHGVLVYDTNVQEALQAMQVLELACRMVVTARAAELDLRTLPEATVRAFLDGAAYKPRRLWPA